MIINISCNNCKKTLEYTSPVRLDKAAADAGFLIQQPCSGRGVCGKCTVTARGNLSPVSDEEAKLLTETELKNGIRLACRTYAEGDATVEVPFADIDGLTEGTADRNIQHRLSDNKVKSYGIAFDIGTTTVAAALYDLDINKRIKTACEINSQARFGADVISRMDYANKGGLAEESKLINDQLKNIEKAFNVSISKRVIVGNTAMLHLLTGTDTHSLCAYPFKANSLFGEYRNNAYLGKCIGSFVGADITSAVLASGMNDKSENSFLVDLGTNGEMAHRTKDGITCCSTAAGPAFEGAGISMGMTAIKGAIDKVFIVNGQLCYTVIGGAEPVGIAGSGLIDAIACMLELGVIDETGYLEEDCYIGESSVCIKPKDIRAVQLAKSAIRSGIDVLCNNDNEIKCFYIAGGFGANLNLNSCVKIGLIPSEFEQKAVVLGNASLTGASMMLCDKNNILKSEKIAAEANDENLGGNPEFNEKYMENMLF